MGGGPIPATLDTASGYSPEQAEAYTQAVRCRALWARVLLSAAKDVRIVERYEEITQTRALTLAERKRLRRIVTDGGGTDFVDCIWFEQICGMLNVEPDHVRRLMDVVP